MFNFFKKDSKLKPRRKIQVTGANEALIALEPRKMMAGITAPSSLFQKFGDGELSISNSTGKNKFFGDMFLEESGRFAVKITCKKNGDLIVKPISKDVSGKFTFIISFDRFLVNGTIKLKGTNESITLNGNEFSKFDDVE